jgi:hypothetical protein
MTDRRARWDGLVRVVLDVLTIEGHGRMTVEQPGGGVRPWQ